MTVSGPEKKGVVLKMENVQKKYRPLQRTASKGVYQPIPSIPQSKAQSNTGMRSIMIFRLFLLALTADLAVRVIIITLEVMKARAGWGGGEMLVLPLLGLVFWIGTKWPSIINWIRESLRG
jgi:hypothetical protein